MQGYTLDMPSHGLRSNARTSARSTPSTRRVSTTVKTENSINVRLMDVKAQMGPNEPTSTGKRRTSVSAEGSPREKKRPRSSILTYHFSHSNSQARSTSQNRDLTLASQFQSAQLDGLGDWLKCQAKSLERDEQRQKMKPRQSVLELKAMQSAMNAYFERLLRIWDEDENEDKDGDKGDETEVEDVDAEGEPCIDEDEEIQVAGGAGL